MSTIQTGGIIWFVLLMNCLPAASPAAEWGNLKGRFVYGGDPPTRKLIAISKDKEYCGKCNLHEEKLIVDRTSRGVANVVVWLYVSSSDTKPPIHESYNRTATSKVSLDSTKCRVDPHVCLLRTTQTLLLRNTDPIGDGLEIHSFKNTSVNVLLPPNGERYCTYPNPERLPNRVSCPVHPWESGWLIVKDHPYMAKTGTDGRFEIGSLPCGCWTFQFWHEAAGYVREVRIDGETQTWRKGRREVTISPGSNDLGDMELAPVLFQR